MNRTHLLSLILISLCLVAAVGADLDVSVQLQAPSTLLPGEASSFSVSATLSNVTILSFPIAASITFPDGTTVPVQLSNNLDGTYQGTFYSGQEGMHTITAVVTLDGIDYTQQAYVNVQKPQLNIAVDASIENGSLSGTITQDTQGSFMLSLAPFAQGEFSSLSYNQTCTFSCDLSCSFSCPAQESAQIARFETNRGFAYALYIPVGTPLNASATYDDPTGVGEPEIIGTSRPLELFTLIGTTLTRVPIVNGEYSFTPQAPGKTSIILKENEAIKSTPLSIITRTNVQTWNPLDATGDTEHWWQGYAAGNDTLLKMPQDPGSTEAYLLSDGTRTQLSFVKGYISLQGAGIIEVRRNIPATPRQSITTPYGIVSGGQGLERHEFLGNIQAYNQALSELDVYADNTTSVLYTQDEQAFVVTQIAGTLSVTPKLKPNEQGTLSFNMQGSGDTTFTIYTLDGILMQRLLFTGTSGTRDLLFTLPPGTYLAVAETDAGRAAAPLIVYSENASISVSPGRTYDTEENTQLTVQHSITSSDLAQSRIVDIQLESPYTTLLNLSDANSNGIPDITLAPGETIIVSASVLVPIGATDGEIIWNASSQELSASASDNVRVNTKTITYTDADVVSISDTSAAPVVHIQNNDHTALAGTLYVSGENLSTQLAITLEPGMNDVAVPAVGERITVRLQLASDGIPENNERTRDFRAPYSTRLVHINERLHADHNTYTILLPTTPGYVLTWIDENGGEQQATSQQQGTDTLWSIGELSANQEFYAALLPGEPQSAQLSSIIDNTDGRVSTQGAWTPAITPAGYLGFDYLTDLNLQKGGAVVYSPGLDHDFYALRLHTPVDPSFADNVPIAILGKSVSSVLVNEQQTQWQYLGLYELDQKSSVAIGNTGTRGFVVADALEFTPISQIGGLAIRGNSSITQNATQGETVRIETAAYLSNIAHIESPQSCTVYEEGSALILIPNETGIHTVVVSDGVLSLTIMLTVHEPPPTLAQNSTASVQGELTIGEPVVWRALVDINDTISPALVPVPEGVLSMNVTALTSQGTQEIESDSIFIIENSTVQDIGEALLLNKAAELDRQEVIATLQEDNQSLADITAEQQTTQVALDTVQTKADTTQAVSVDAVAAVVAASNYTSENNQTLVHISDLPSDTKQLLIEYTTEPPEIIVNDTSPYEQTLTVTSVTHYENISAYLDIIPSPKESIRLYRTTDGISEQVNLAYDDWNNDSLIDRIEWVVPHLSNQTYNLSITVLNPVSYLRDGDTWTVYFNTTGIGNLTIDSNNSDWEEMSVDINTTTDEMRFIDFECGNSSMLPNLELIDDTGAHTLYSAIPAGSSIRVKAFFVQDYTCNETASFVNYMNIAGYAVLRFNYTDSISSIQDVAIDPAVGKYDARIYVYDTKNTTSIADDTQIGNVNLSGATPNGLRKEIGEITGSLYSYDTYIVEVQIEGNLTYNLDGDYHEETVIYAKSPFVSTNTTSAGEYQITTTWVPNDNASTDDIFVSTTHTVNYSTDANTGEVGTILGDPDAASAITANDDLQVYTNPTSGIFSTEWTQVDADTNVGVMSTDNNIATADFDLDGDYDILVSDDDDDVRLYDNDGTPFAGTMLEWNVSTNVGAQTQDVNALASADLNADNYPDVIAGIQTNDDIYVYQNDQTPFGNGWTEQSVNTSTGGDVNDIATGDFDRDGDVDLVGAIEGVNDIILYVSDGTPFNGGWTARYIDSNTGNEPQVVKAVDIDSDGDLDVVQGDSGNDVDVYCNDGTGALTENSLYNGASTSSTSISIGDIDNDGDPDILFSVPGAFDIYYLENDGTPCAGTLTARTVTTNTVNNPWEVRLADFDGDGWLDVMVATEDDTIINYQNDKTPANGAWTANNMDASTGSGVSFPPTLAVADLDNDRSGNILDFFTSKNENIEQGAGSFAGWDNLSASTNYSFYFITQPDYDFTFNSTDNLTILLGNESGTGWTRSYENIFGGNYYPIKAMWNWSINRQKWVTVNNMTVSNTTPSRAATITVKCHVITNSTGIDKYEWYNYTTSFYSNGALVGTNVTNSTGWAVYSFVPGTVGTYPVMCNPQDAVHFDFATTGGNMSTSITVSNNVPTHSTPVLNSTFGTNLSTENLTAYNQSTTDADGDRVTNIWTWILNTRYLEMTHLAFDTTLNSTSILAANSVRDYARDLNGTCGPDAGVCPGWTSSGRSGGAINFSAINVGAIDLGDKSDFDLADNYTIMLWIYPTAGADSMRLISKQNGGAGGWELRLDTTSANSFRWDYGPTGYSSGSAWGNNRWIHVAITNNDSLSTFYVNGTAWGTLANGNPPTNAVNLTIGATPNHAGDYIGLIDDVRIWNRSLTASQVAQIYNEGIQGLANATITAGESKGGEVWQACDTPNDNSSDGTTRCSNNLTVIGIIDADSPANNTVIDRDSVNASDVDTVTLTADAGLDSFIVVNFYANLTYPSIAGQTNLLLGTNITNLSGQASISFNPNSTHYAGSYTWWPQATNYKTNSNVSFLVYGGINLTYQNATYNPNATYFINQTIETRVNVTSHGGPENKNNFTLYTINVNSTLRNTSANVDTIYGNYTLASQYWNATHNWITFRGVGSWNSSVNVSSPFWYSNVTTRLFTMYSYMNVTSNVTNSSMFAYQTALTSCRVQDQFGGYAVSGATVSFYRNNTLIGTNTTNSTGDASLTYSVNATGLWLMSCYVADQVGIYYYRGAAYNGSNYLLVNGFPITPLISAANNTSVDRDSVDSTDADIITLNVSVPNYVPSGTTINFTANLSNPSGIAGTTSYVLGSNTTNSSGNAILHYNPNASSYAGNWSWYGTNGAGSANGTMYFASKGSFNTVYMSASLNPNSTYFRNSTITTEINVTTPGPETGTQLNNTYTIAVASMFRNTSGTASSVVNTFNGTQWNNNTFSPLNLAGVGSWFAIGNTTGTYWYTNWTNRTFNLYGYMNVTTNTTTPSSMYAFQNTTTSCTVRDQHTGYSVSGATVSFYRNGTLLGTNTTNSTGTADKNYNVNVTGTYTITCNVTDQLGIFYYRGAAPEGNSTLVVNPFLIDAVSPASGTTVDRDSVDASDPDLLSLTLAVPNYIPDGTPIEARANLSIPAGIAGTTSVLLGTNTTSAHTTIIYYNPNATSYAGLWIWYGNNTGGGGNNSLTFISKGGLNTTYNSSSINPNSTYFRNSTITTEINVSSLGPETLTQLNNTYNITVASMFRNTSGIASSVVNTFNGTRWNNNTFSPLNLAGVGSWFAIGNTTGTYWYTNWTNRTFNLYGYMNITSNSSSPSSMIAYQSTTTTCGVRDQNTGYQVSGAIVSFYRNGTLLGTNTTNSTGQTDKTFSINSTGTWIITCNVSDQLGIFYYRGAAPEGNSTVTVTPFSITPLAPANNTVVDRDGTDATDPDFITLNVSVPNFVADGVMINFTANLTTPSGIAGTTSVVLGNNTTAGGYAIIHYNPNSSMYAGVWTWAGNTGQGYGNGTGIEITKGSYNTTYNSSINPNSTYFQNDTITTEVNISSLGPETPTQLNNTYSIIVRDTFRNSTGIESSVVGTFNGTRWNNNTFTILTLKGVGPWHAAANTTGTYWYTNHTNRTFIVYGYMNVTSNVTSPSSIFAYQTATTTCGVQDQHTGYTVSGAVVSFYRNGTLLGTNTTNSTGQTDKSYNVNTTGTYTITCNVSDQLGIYYYRGDAPSGTSTLTVQPFPITPISPANDSIVDRDGVDASDPDLLTLNLSVPSYVPAGVMLNFSASLTEPLGIAGTTNALLGNNTTDATGFAVLYYNPSSVSYAGNWTWYGQNDSGVANGTRRFIVKGGFNTTYNSSLNPNGTYFQNSTITTEINVTSLGPETLAQLNNTYNITVANMFRNTSGTASSVVNTFNGTRWNNNTFSALTLAGVGSWFSIANTTGTYWYTNWTNRTFTVYGYMNITSNSTAPTPIYTYQTTSTTCGVQDHHTGYAVSGATVSFYRAGILLGTNTTNSTGHANLSYSVNASGTWTITCNVSNQVGIYYYAGPGNEGNSTIVVLPFPLTPVNPANNTIVDRDGADGTDPDFLTLNISVPGYIPDGVMINFTANLSNPSIGGQSGIWLGNNTTTSGYAYLLYNPNASTYAGNYTWWGNNSAGTQNGSMLFTSKGSYAVVYADNSLLPNSTYFQNDTISASLNVTSNGLETRDELNSSYGILANNTYANTTASTSTIWLMYNGSQWNNNTFSILALKGVGVWNTTANVSGSFWYNNGTNRSLTVYGYMNVTNNTLNPTTVYAYQYTTTTCGVQDQHTSYTVQNANVTFYRNGTYLGYNTTNSSGHTDLTFQTNTSGTYIITCNVTNQPSIYYYRGDAPERNSTLTVIPFPINVVSPANGTTVDRDSVDASDPDLITLNVSVPNYIPDGVPIGFTANLTTPSGIAGTTDVVLGSNTTSSGYAILHYNPSAATYAGNWTWGGNNTNGYTNNTAIYTSKGALNTAYRNNSFYPNASYNQTDTASIEVNVTSSGPESRDELNSSYTITVRNTITNTSGINNNVTLTYPSPYWSGSHTLSTLYGVGTWSTLVNSSGSFWYSNMTNRTFTLYGFMNVTSNSTSPASIYTYQSLTGTCRVQDQLSGYPVSGASVSFYRDSTLVGSNTTNSSGHTDFTFQTNTSGTHSMLCNVTDQPGIYYYRGLAPQGNATYTVLPFPIDAIAPANGTTVDRDSVDASDPDLITLNASVPSYVPDGVQLDFRANLTTPSGIAGTTDVVLGSNTTSSGYAILHYNPSAATYAGNWTWWGTNNSGTVNSTAIYTSKGGLNTTYLNATYNPNATYFQSDTILANVNVTSLGPETRDELNSSYGINVNETYLNSTASTSTVWLMYNGSQWINNTFTILMLKGVGVWNTSANSSGSFWYNNATNRTLIVYGYMNVTSNSTSPTSIYTYQSATSTCGVQDQDTNYTVAGATVSFYRSGTLLGTNTTNSTGQTSLTYSVNITGTYTITCNVTNQLGIYYYAGLAPEGNSTLTVLPFPITPVNPANATIVDRDSVDATDPDFITLNVSVPSYVPDGVMINFTANLTTPSIVGQHGIWLGNNTTSSGYAYYIYNPNSTTYAGNYSWWGNNSAGTQNGTRDFISKGSISPVFRNNTFNPNTAYNETDTITLEANLTSGGPETRDELNSTYSAGMRVNISNPSAVSGATILSYVSPYWNGSFALPTLSGVGNWTAFLISNASYFYDQNSSNRSFLVYGVANVTNITLSASTIYAYQSTTATCAVINGVTSVPAPAYNITFSRNATVLGTNQTDASGHASYTFQTNSSGVYTVNCTIGDDLAIYYYGLLTTINTTLTVNKYPITPISPANDTIVDRDGVAADPDVILLNVSVPAVVPDGLRIEFRANLTDPTGIASTTNVLLGNNTTSSGYAWLWFNPNSSIYAGNYSWFGNETEGTNNGTNSVLVRGSYTIAYADGSLNPNSTYFQNDTVTTSLNLTSSGPETTDQLNASYAALANNTFQNASGIASSVWLMYNGSQWKNTTFNLLSLAGVGIWNSTAASSATHFYTPNSTNRSLIVYGYMNITANATAPSSIFAYQTTTTTCGVQDQFSGYAVSGATVGFYRSGTLLGTNTTNSTGNASLSYNVNSTGTYTITCNVTDQPSVYYYRGDAPSGTSTLIVLPFPVDTVSPANGTVVDRDNYDASDPDFVLLNVTVPSYVPDGVNVSFSANLTTPASISANNQFLGSNTTSSGYAALYYNPATASYAGNWTWWGNSTSSFTNSTAIYTSKGALAIVYRNNTFNPNAAYNQTDIAVIETNVTSSGPESRDELNSSYGIAATSIIANTSGTTSASSFVYRNPFWNTSHALSALAGVGVWSASANTSGYFWYNNSTTRAFSVYGFMNVTSNSTLPSSTFAFQNATTTCGVQDQSSGYAIQNANITFYRNSTYLGYNVTDVNGNASITYRLNQTGTYIIICNVTNQPNIYYSRGSQPEQNGTLTVLPFPIGAESPANDTAVDRDGTNASTPDFITLNASVPSYVPNGVTIDFTANLTDPSGIVGTTIIILGSNTTNGGYAYVHYNPSSASYAGNWTWWGARDNALQNSTLTFSSYGSINVTFQNTTHDPNANYDKPANVTIGANFTSFGSVDTANIINTYYTPTLNTTINKPDGSLFTTMNLTFNTTNRWNNTFALVLSDPRGIWNAILNGSLNWFYINNTASRTFIVNNIAPTQSNPVLNASDNPLNTTDANLTAYNQSTDDYEGDTVTNIWTWKKNGQNYEYVYLPFDTNISATTSGLIRDYAGSYNATLGNGTSGTEPTWNVSGKRGGAYSFDGVDDEIIVSDIPSPTSMTGAAWVNVKGNMPTGGTIISKSSEYLFYIRLTGYLRVILNGTAIDDTSFNYTANTNSWHHVAFTYDANTSIVRLFRDGMQSANGTHTNGIPNNATTLSIGRINNVASGSPFNGSIDDVHLYNRSLSAEQIQQLFVEGNMSLSNSSISFNETTRDDVWQACVTANDNANDSTTNCSNSLTIYGLLDAFSPANGTTVDRDSFDATDPDSINLVAWAHGDANINVSFYANLTSPSIGGQTNILLGTALSNASGYANLAYNPNATMYAGNYTWWPQAANTTTLSSADIVIKGSYSVAYASALNPNSTYFQNDTITTNVNLTSNGPESSSQLNASYAALANNTFQNSTGNTSIVNLTYNGSLWRNNTFSLLTLKGVGVWNTSANSSATWFYNPAGANRTFAVYGFANVTSMSMNPNPVDAYNYVNVSCRVQDEHTGYDINSINVTFWQEGVSIGSGLTNSTGWASVLHQEVVDGLFNVTCDVADQLSLYYYAGDQRNITQVLNVTPILLTPSQPANDTQVDRDSVDGVVGDSITLVGRTIPTVPDGIIIDFWANITDPIGTGQAILYLGNNTTNSTYINLTIDPSSAVYAGNYTWYMNSSGGISNGTARYIVMGGVNITYSDATTAPRFEYNESDIASFTLNMTSYGPETRSVLNSTYNSTLNLTLGTPVNGSILKQPTFNGSTHNDTQALYGYGPGIWNTSAVIDQKYFFPVQYTLRNFTVYGFINLLVFDTEEYYTNGTIWANNVGLYFANATDSFGLPLTNANCTASFFDRSFPLGYDAGTQLYNNTSVFSLEGFVRYNVSCAKQFYNTNTTLNNVTVQSVVNVTLTMNSTDLSQPLREITFNVTNLENYTEHDIWVEHIIPAGFVVNYTTPIVNTQIISGQYSGNSTIWYIPNLTAGQSTLVRYNASGIANITDLFQAGLRVKSSNTSVIY